MPSADTKGVDQNNSRDGSGVLPVNVMTCSKVLIEILFLFLFADAIVVLVQTVIIGFADHVSVPVTGFAAFSLERHRIRGQHAAEPVWRRALTPTHCRARTGAASMRHQCQHLSLVPPAQKLRRSIFLMQTFQSFQILQQDAVV